MKAWRVWDCTNEDAGIDIVWANNVKEAKYKGQLTQVGEELESYTDLRVRREKALDDMENLSDKDLAKEQWMLGWTWHEGTILPYFDELDTDKVDKVWDEWYYLTDLQNLIEIKEIIEDSPINHWDKMSYISTINNIIQKMKKEDGDEE